MSDWETKSPEEQKLVSVKGYTSDPEIAKLLPYMGSVGGTDSSLVFLYLLLRAPTHLLFSPTDKICRVLAIAARSLQITGEASGDVEASDSQIKTWTETVRRCLAAELLRRQGVIEYSLGQNPLSFDNFLEVTIASHDPSNLTTKLTSRFPGFLELSLRQPVETLILGRILNQLLKGGDLENGIDLHMESPEDVRFLIQLQWLYNPATRSTPSLSQSIHYVNWTAVTSALKAARIDNRHLKVVPRID